MKNLPGKLRKWMAARQFTQAQAAEQLGMNLRTLQDWLQGRHAPGGLALQKLLEILRT